MGLIVLCGRFTRCANEYIFNVLVLTGVYPLFRRSAADLQGAALRVHITGVLAEEDWDAASRPAEPNSEEERLPEVTEIVPEDANLTSEEVEAEAEASTTVVNEILKEAEAKADSKATRATPDFTVVQQAAVAEDESFVVTLAVDQAMHLNLNGEFKKIIIIQYKNIFYQSFKSNPAWLNSAGFPPAEFGEGSPHCCVSYVTAEAEEPTTVTAASSDSPVWNHQQQCR